MRSPPCAAAAVTVPPAQRLHRVWCCFWEALVRMMLAGDDVRGSALLRCGVELPRRSGGSAPRAVRSGARSWIAGLRAVAVRPAANLCDGLQ